MVTKPLTPKQAAKQLVTTREAIQTFEAALAEFDVGSLSAEQIAFMRSIEREGLRSMLATLREEETALMLLVAGIPVTP